MVTDVVLAEVRDGLRRSRTSQAVDGWLYNGGVVFTLLCTGIATIIGAVNNVQDPTIPLWVAPLLSGLATIWVGIDRALQFGLRWRFHRSISAAHQSILNRIVSLDLLPAEERADELKVIRDALVNLPNMDPNVPGVDAKDFTQQDHKSTAGGGEAVKKK
ncbi:hypothetical protein [Pseudorhodoferax sp.]|uniref:hypothetical protein n=1 Tax=Pseudorhodoferax sp. TaxID=1993553 RepID=UPI0039E4B4BA